MAVMRPIVSGANFPSQWLAHHNPIPHAGLRLFCFPYAGGNASMFRKWQRYLANVEVCPIQMPGRGGRLHEETLTSVREMATAIADELLPYFRTPFALFGHSMGTLTAFEVARNLRREHNLLPVHLFVSGGSAPQLPMTEPLTYNLPDTEFKQDLRRLEGTPAEFFEHPELMELLLPLLRADFEAVQTYDYESEAPFDCPISAFGGIADREVTRERLEAWRERTTGGFSLRMFPGGHFFVREAEPLLLKIISQDLSRRSV